jgi:glycosyltransferase involved in cell wall biosynthesis
VQHADAIVSLTNAGKRIILGWPGMEYSKKITVIPCSVDMNLFSFDQLHPGKLREIHSKIDSPLIIGYYGSLGTWYMLPEMLEQFKAIQNTHPLAKFLIVSNEDWQSSYDGLLEQKGISKSSIYFTRSSREDMPYYIGATDIALFFIKSCYSKLSSSPTKHGEIMSMGKPLITNSGVGDLNEIITNSNTGYILHSFDSESLELAANSIPHILKMESKKIRSECKEYYSLESALNKYQHIYHQLT